MERSEEKVLLVIIDGWGIAPENAREQSAIEKASTPYLDEILQSHPNSQLRADGMAVGLPEGQIGNSEVGHINIGAGRIVYQMLLKINKAVEEHGLQKNEQLLDALDYAKEEGKKVHILGLVSDGGVHSHIDHLKVLCDIACGHHVKELYIHAITDGRDTDPNSGVEFIADLQGHLHETTGKLASITGRYYAMDRGENWDRTAIAYHALVHGRSQTQVDGGKWKEAMEEKYRNGETDEFINPIVLKDNSKPVTTVSDGDVIICFNYRPDRVRQITRALTQQDFPNHNMKKMDFRYLTMTQYDRRFTNVSVLFEHQDLELTLGEVLSNKGKKQIRIAESIKYPHVTYFFSGGREEPFEGEDRIMVDTVDVSTFDKTPEMSAAGIRDEIIPILNQGSADFICLNFANPDMVGHSGDMEATIKACETIDSCLKSVAEAARGNHYAVMIVSDHGNAEKMTNHKGVPFTSHTSNPVPCIVIRNRETHKLSNGKLCDVAPTVLSLMGIETPEEMTGSSLLRPE
ncbi:2,3-bisphosphoglycerate-independent phosphoglycerate mutase [Algoriphagus sp. AGSA1]|uniref:2,3-bisphosphoglycerate-independent phosphoglycerate mutase n=1 Tax=Algoriphagus sp. AGSA1 TaxID=2907213 RepID=UPI001F417B35|nr:2,3-bisphosphoglycerate-independent phosphoglycerate mutase [Algoriphagus sp. AGSA1]MCE7056416.1 2,3-bisphosphoglycerate-independent phosphoglycerate mutase [Algoriphagus sp. AGSA1]